MSISRTQAIAAVLLFALTATAQPVNPTRPQRFSMEYTPVSCIRAGELPLLQVKVEGEGEIRAYFRKINTSDWCSVEGTNLGPLSRVVLPKFDAGDEIEYFFVLLQGRRVMARSPRIFRARVSLDCELPWARHNYRLSMSCGNDVQGIPSATNAGYSLKREDEEPVSPFQPTQ